MARAHQNWLPGGSYGTSVGIIGIRIMRMFKTLDWYNPKIDKPI